MFKGWEYSRVAETWDVRNKIGNQYGNKLRPDDKVPYVYPKGFVNNSKSF